MRYGFALFAGTAPAVIDATAAKVEALGFNSFWVNNPGRIDGLAALAGAARTTERIDLGVGVIPLNSRSPEEIAATVQRLELPAARLLLGVGSPNPGALSRVREGVETLRQELGARLIVAALGPRMCRLAGEVADGVLLNWLTPEYARRSADDVRAGALAAGRPPPALFAYVRLAVGPAGRVRLQQESDTYGSIPQYAANFERQGVSPIETAIYVEESHDLPGAVAAWDGVVDEVVFRAVTANDTLDEILTLAGAAAPK